MIIDACERFSRNAKKRNPSTAQFTETAKVVRLVCNMRSQSEKGPAAEQKPAKTPAAISHHHSRTLRETFGTMVFRSNDITAAFYKRLTSPQWWDKPHFTSLISADSGDLMNALMGMAYDPPRPALMERFLKEARTKFQNNHQIPSDDRIMAVNLVAAINEANRNHWNESVQIAWQNALHPDNIFNENSTNQHDHG